jgi:hypothetical protein
MLPGLDKAKKAGLQKAPLQDCWEKLICIEKIMRKQVPSFEKFLTGGPLSGVYSLVADYR